MNPLTLKLVSKEFSTHRWLIGGSIVAGLASLAVVALGGHMNFNIGFLIWLTTIAAFGAVVAMFGVATERKERVLNWVLSLPISHGDYVRFKVLALLLCFVAVWLPLSGAAVALVAVKPDLPDGLMPVTVLLSVFMLVNYSLVLCSAVHVHSEGPMTIVIVLHNIAITLFLFLIVAIGDIQRHMQGPVPVWNSAFWTVLAVELLVFAVLACTPYLVAARRRDFV
jgi:hypothetical protein